MSEGREGTEANDLLRETYLSVNCTEKKKLKSRPRGGKETKSVNGQSRGSKDFGGVEMDRAGEGENNGCYFVKIWKFDRVTEPGGENRPENFYTQDNVQKKRILYTFS